MGLAGEKTFFVRAPGEIIPDKLIVYRVDFLLRRGARTLRVFYWPAGCKLLRLRSRAGPPTKVERTPTKAPTGPRGELAMLRIAWDIRKRKPNKGRDLGAML